FISQELGRALNTLSAEANDAVTASIAAYKAADIASKLTKQDRSVHVVMMAGATQFITPLTLQTLSRHPVTTNIFDEKISWHPGHIELADNADLVLIAPATADILAKLAHGFADDALTSIVLATEAPLLLAPAMNGKMWMHPATVANVEILRQRGANFIGPEKGMLACGYEGIGRLWPVEEIVAKSAGIQEALTHSTRASAKNRRRDPSPPIPAKRLI